MKLIDLSNWIEEGMPNHPYDDKPSLFQDKFLDKDKYNNYIFNSSTHVGTHMDSPKHLLESDKFIGEYPLDNFCGKACVIDVRGKTLITYEPVYEDIINKKDIVLLYTGFDKNYLKPEYFTEHPVIDKSFAELLVRKDVKLIGMDMPSPDRYPFEIHKRLFTKGIFIIENLTNINELLGEKEIEFFAFPLRIKADASWIRAIAKIK